LRGARATRARFEGARASECRGGEVISAAVDPRRCRNRGNSHSSVNSIGSKMSRRRPSDGKEMRDTTIAFKAEQVHNLVVAFSIARRSKSARLIIVGRR
jgi:hypothetical protein